MSVKYTHVPGKWEELPPTDPKAGTPIQSDEVESPPTSSTSSGGSGGSSVSEEAVVEYLATYISAKAEVVPDDLSYRHGDLVRVRGVGSQFSGLYYTEEVNYRVTSGRLIVTLSLLRVGMGLFDESQVSATFDQPRQEREVVEIPKEERRHTVSAGETLSHIALQYYGDANKWRIIWEANKDMLIQRDSRNIENPGWFIYPGQSLVIP